jgi:hypothetical protein
MMHSPHFRVVALLPLCSVGLSACAGDSPAADRPTYSAAISDALCPDARAHEEYQGDWLLAKACTAAVNAAEDGVKSKLTSLAKGALASTINSFLPGVGSLLLGLGGGGGDPFAAHAQRIIDEIRESERRTNNNLTKQIDDAVQILLERDNTKQVARFSSVLEYAQVWSGMDAGTKLDQSQYILDLQKDVISIRNTFEAYLLSRVESSVIPPYDTLRLLHYYVLLLDLEFQITASASYWPALTSSFLNDRTQSFESLAKSFEASGKAEQTRAQTSTALRTLFERANSVADQIARTDAIFHNTVWHTPILDKDEAPGDRVPAVDEGDPKWPPSTELNESNGWGDANTVAFNWFQEPYYTFVGRNGDRFCTTPLFTESEMVRWGQEYQASQGDPNAKTYRFAPPFENYVTTWAHEGLFTHGPRPYCATRRSANARYFGEPKLFWDPTPKELYFDPNILDALRVLQREHAMTSAEYASTFSTAYAPLRVALDKWWRNLRNLEPSLPAHRAYNASDEEYDRLLWSNDRDVLSTIGASGDISMGLMVEYLTSTSDTTAPTPEVRSKLVGFALEYGVDAIIQLSNQAFALDADHLIERDGRRVYPLALMEAYIDRYAGDGVSIDDYYTRWVDEVLEPSVHYSAFKQHTVTGLHETGANVEFEYASNGDLFAIFKSGTGSGTTEVHVLSAASGYRDFSLHTATALGETGDNFTFALAANRDLVAIAKSGTGTASTELHVLSAASNYGEFVLHTGTALHETNASFAFLVASNDDLVAISKQGGSGKTEVHVLSAASGYQQFITHAVSALEPTGDNFTFALAPNRDLFAIKRSQTGSGTTEVHVLAAASDYGTFALHAGSALHETDASFDFALAPNRDLVAIKKSGTGSAATELHVLSH